MIPPGLRRNVLRAIALAFFIILGGATYQGVATAIERRQYPRQGGMVPTGTHQLHLHCRGQGSPIVVLEAGAIGMSSAWGWVQADVAPVTRVCSYDRAGLGWSESGPQPFSAGEVVRQFSAMLAGAREMPPYIVVGHGLGAAFATLYAADAPGSVHSLILIDSPIGQPSSEPDRVLRLAHMWPWLARTGVLRLSGMLSERAAGLPPDAEARLSAFLNRPDHLARAAIELEAWEEIVAQASAATLDQGIAVTRVDVAGRERIALLSDSDTAAAAAAAILTAVAAATH